MPQTNTKGLRPLSEITKAARRGRLNQQKGLCYCGKRPPRLNRRRCQECTDYHKRGYQLHKSKALAAAKKYWLRDKNIILDHYGRLCVCCGEDYVGFLVLDHIKGGGTRHRAEVDKEYGRGSNFYKWLIKHEFPPEVQVLCANCNMAKGVKDRCPCPYSTL